MPQEFKLILKHADEPGYTPDIECYLRHGGYDALKKALAIQPKDLPDGKKKSPQEQIRDDVKLSGLRGRGGAGFSCGLKWSFVDRRSGKPIYLICNADESEPGTFKDRQIIHKDPHQLIEGMIISCFANDVKLAYIYIRGEMPEGAKLLNAALKEARAKNFLGKNILGSGYDLEIHVHRGAGAYICGEETGLIESLEGKRPYPRIKPPYFPAVLGLYMCPTIVNNVETLCNVKHIVAMGGAEFAKLGTPNNTGTRIVSLSGHVKRPGYYEIEVGKATIGELINDPAFGGGLRDGRKLKAVIPGGSSAKVFKAGEKFKLKRKGGRQRRRAGSGHARSALRLRFAHRRRLDERFERHHRDGRLDRHRRGAGEHQRILRARKLRPMHALPRRFALDEQGAASPHARRRPQERRGLSREDRRQHSRRPHDLRVRRSLLVAGAKFRGEVQR